MLVFDTDQNFLCSRLCDTVKSDVIVLRLGRFAQESVLESLAEKALVETVFGRVEADLRTIVCTRPWQVGA